MASLTIPLDMSLFVGVDIDELKRQLKDYAFSLLPKLQKQGIKKESCKKRKIIVSDRIKALTKTTTSEDFDYKDDMDRRWSEKYN